MMFDRKIYKKRIHGIGTILVVFDFVFRVFASGHFHIGMGVWTVLKNLSNWSTVAMIFKKKVLVYRIKTNFLQNKMSATLSVLENRHF